MFILVVKMRFSFKNMIISTYIHLSTQMKASKIVIAKQDLDVELTHQ